MMLLPSRALGQCQTQMIALLNHEASVNRSEVQTAPDSPK